jgi:SAM-dependent methyltransferase
MLKRIRNEIGHWCRKSWSFAMVGEHWDQTEDYDEINEDTYSYFRRFVDGLRLGEVPPDSLVLDFCARTGNGTTYYFQHGTIRSAVCADVSFKMGEICVRRLRESGLPNFIWVPIMDYTFPFDSKAFDGVLCFETVEHFAEPEKLLRELGRVTRQDGFLILTTPNVLWEPVHALAAILNLHHSEGPHRFIRQGRLFDMVRAAGFRITKSETTVLIPGGPQKLIQLGKWIEERTRDSLMPLFGLRRIVIARKI